MDDFFKIVFNSVNDGIAVYNSDGYFLEINNAICRYCGYSKDEILQMNVFELIHSEPGENENILVAQNLRHDNETVETTCRCKDGSLLPIELSISTILCNGEKLYLAVLRDITKRKLSEMKLEKSREQFMLAVQGSNDGIWDWDLHGHGLYLSPRCKEIIGYEEHELPDNFSTLDNIICPQDSDWLMNKLETYINGDSSVFKIKFRAIHRNGGYRWILARGVALRDENGNVCRMAGSATDITARKQQEKELLSAKQEAEASNNAKSEFIANISHELRTPLTSVIGFSEILREGIAGELTEKQRDYIGRINKSGKHLLELINDILDISKIEAGNTDIKYNHFSAHEIFDEILSVVTPIASEKEISLNFENNMWTDNIYADEVKFKQIMYNLLGNAIKFTPDNGIVSVIATQNNGDIQISVTDTGIGIPSNRLTDIFNPFTQIDSSSRKKYKGAGLGLAITKQLVEIHKGNIWAQSEEGKGSTFVFSIPAE